MLGAFCDFLPPRRKVLEPHREDLLLELEDRFCAHADSDHHADGAQAALRRMEQVGIFGVLAGHAHDRGIGQGQDDVEERRICRDRGKSGAGAVSRGREGAGEGLIGDGAEGRKRERAALEQDRMQIPQEDTSLGMESPRLRVDLCGMTVIRGSGESGRAGLVRSGTRSLFGSSLADTHIVDLVEALEIEDVVARADNVAGRVTCTGSTKRPALSAGELDGVADMIDGARAEDGVCVCPEGRRPVAERERCAGADGDGIEQLLEIARREVIERRGRRQGQTSHGCAGGLE